MLRRMADIDVKLGLRTILEKIEIASGKRIPELQYAKPQLVAVSKTKPTNLIIEAYEEGQRHFGENYVQELIEKSNSTDILEKCKEIKWHFIGHVQTNKVNKILAVPNLYMIETVHTKKLATALNQKWPEFRKDDGKLRVMLQVNTSGEDAKNGVEPSEIVDLTRHVSDNCKNLEVDGIMTIGQFGYNLDNGPNPDFICLKKCRDEICQSLGWDFKNVNLSMGMSDDFEHAIEMGSTNVRVGSSIFGYRPKKN
ncbi:hypothetical protein PPYR_11809 [Photinus pyralis]|uniref:Pyridoxal phosphate homeostasis protein n=1 Tax=Photinus pyralis TaxID=7054 RepID=A0A1Y1K2I7_PHOPY|nr:pyridoxal phosphate homeostasis protein [Photinus pyralis]KAB0794970.1 hypothetical protein PPYR_11809 [Photinus pyralis]